MLALSRHLGLSFKGRTAPLQGAHRCSNHLRSTAQVRADETSAPVDGDPVSCALSTSRTVMASGPVWNRDICRFESCRLDVRGGAQSAPGRSQSLQCRGGDVPQTSGVRTSTSNCDYASLAQQQSPAFVTLRRGGGTYKRLQAGLAQRESCAFTPRRSGVRIPHPVRKNMEGSVQGDTQP